MATTLTVREVAPAEYDQWHRLITSSPDGSIYSDPAYLDVLCSVTSARFRVLGVWLGEELSGGIALYEQECWYGTYAGPRLLLYYHSPVARHFDSRYPSERTAKRVRILGALAETLVQQPLAGLTLKCRHTVADIRPFAGSGWVYSPSYTYVVPLDDLATQRARVEQNLRRLINRAESQGVVVTDDDDIGGFFALHEATMHRKGAATYLSRDALTDYFRRLRALDLCRLYLARLPGGEAIAGQLVLLGSNPVSHTVMAVSDEAHLKLGASPYLRWKSFEFLAALGKRGNDLTDAALGPVTHFKSQLGGDLVLCHVLQPRPRPTLRLAQRIDETRWRVRGAADRVLRRVTARASSSHGSDANGS